MSRIVRIWEALPESIESLVAAASSEGYRNMARLADDWASGAARFDQPGEALFAAFAGESVTGVGGVTREPTDPTGAVLRARRLYVAPRFRMRGIARALVGALMQEAFQSAPRLYVNAHANAHGFWENMGFVRAQEVPGITHMLMR